MNQSQTSLQTTPQIQAVMANQATSYWLRSAINALLVRDPLDALKDAEALKELMHERYEDLLKLHRKADHS